MSKVFISYSHDSETHKKWVFEFASKLRANGVDVIFDQFEARLGSDLPLFMEQGLSQSTRVLCVCSDRYNEKANSGLSGVGYEKRVICSDLLKDSSTAWVIPIIRNCTSETKVPKFLSSLKYITFEDDATFPKTFYELIRDLHDQTNLPPLGKNPFEHSADVFGKVDELIQISRSLSVSVQSEGTARFNYISNSNEYSFGTGVYEFRTNWSSRGSDSVYAYSDGVKSIAWAPPSFKVDSIVLDDLDFSSRTRSVKVGENIIWVNSNGKILVTRILGITSENEQAQWLDLEYKIVEKFA